MLMNNIFINEFINNGINAYLLKKQDKDYSLAHIFELKVIEVLIRIYGEINIINPYRTGSEKSLRDNFKIYGLTNEEYYRFIGYLNDYNDWLNSMSREKNDTIKEIELLLIRMILLKNINVKATSDDIEVYDDLFLAKDRKIAQINEMASTNPYYVQKYYLRKKKIYFEDNDLHFEEIEPDLLSKTMYQRHGLSINEVVQLSNLKINEINNIITSEEEDLNKSKLRVKPIGLNVVLTSGSGFVDTLVLLSIMVTEIMVGFVIAMIAGRL